MDDQDRRRSLGIVGRARVRIAWALRRAVFLVRTRWGYVRKITDSRLISMIANSTASAA